MNASSPTATYWVGQVHPDNGLGAGILSGFFLSSIIPLNLFLLQFPPSLLCPFMPTSVQRISHSGPTATIASIELWPL